MNLQLRPSGIPVILHRAQPGKLISVFSVRSVDVVRRGTGYEA